MTEGESCASCAVIALNARRTVTENSSGARFTAQSESRKQPPRVAIATTALAALSALGMGLVEQLGSMGLKRVADAFPTVFFTSSLLLIFGLVGWDLWIRKRVDTLVEVGITIIQGVKFQAQTLMEDGDAIEPQKLEGGISELLSKLSLASQRAQEIEALKVTWNRTQSYKENKVRDLRARIDEAKAQLSQVGIR